MVVCNRSDIEQWASDKVKSRDVKNSLLITHYSLLITHYSLLITHYSLLITPYPLFPIMYKIAIKQEQ
ncbi:MAG: hypothetical protein ACRC2V_25030, partial [Xenococcaceae cyanobacterium]